MDIAFIVDPLDQLKAYKDTSIAMMRAAAGRGHAIHAMQQADLVWRGGKVEGRTQALTVHADNDQWCDPGPLAMHPLTDFDALIMRKDPPFDMEYVYSTYLLELAEKDGARVFNKPRAIR